jgi:hypothetical protein
MGTFVQRIHFLLIRSSISDFLPDATNLITQKLVRLAKHLTPWIGPAEYGGVLSRKGEAIARENKYNFME